MFSKLRTYRNIVGGRFNLTGLIRIERKNNKNTISNKTYDYSSKTINKSLKQGYSDSIDYGKNHNQNQNKEKAMEVSSTFWKFCS
jgi:SAM-dependent MidA family methyltransferase